MQLSDFLVFVGWIWHNSVLIFQAIITPIKFVFYFLQNLSTNALANPIEAEEIWSFSEETMNVFQSIPYWDILVKVCLLGILIIVLFSVLRVFHKT